MLNASLVFSLSLVEVIKERSKLFREVHKGKPLNNLRGIVVNCNPYPMLFESAKGCAFQKGTCLLLQGTRQILPAPN